MVDEIKSTLIGLWKHSIEVSDDEIRVDRVTNVFNSFILLEEPKGIVSEPDSFFLEWKEEGRVIYLMHFVMISSVGAIIEAGTNAVSIVGEINLQKQVLSISIINGNFQSDFKFFIIGDGLIELHTKTQISNVKTFSRGYMLRMT